MNKDRLIIFTICFTGALIFAYKYYKYYIKRKNMQKVDAFCTDTTYETRYNKNIYIYYYAFFYKEKEYHINDTLKYKLFFKPKIKDKLYLYINTHNPNDYITPYEVFINKIRYYLTLLLILVPFLTLI